MKINVLLFLIFIQLCAGLRSSLKNIGYNPLQFNLIFSQNISLPSFQILVDNKNLEYKVLTQQKQSDLFKIQITQNLDQIDIQNTQIFSLVFNYPLDIQNGTLFIGQYIITPQKNNFHLQTSSWPGFLIFIILALSSIQGIIGNSVIDFMQLYILIQLKFYHTTSLISQLSKIFFFNQNDHFKSQSYLLALSLPTIIIIFTYLFGIAVKIVCKYIKNSILKKKIIKFCSYDIFFTIWIIQLPSVLFLGLDFIYDIQKRSTQLSYIEYLFGVIITYLNFVNVFIYLYLLYFILNPKPFSSKQKQEQKFKTYLFSQEFKNYNKFYIGLHLLNWTKRNLVFFASLRKFLIVALFFYVQNISPYVLASQFIVLFFLFTVRPYKQQFYTYSGIIFTLIWFFFFIIVIQGDLYFSMDPSTLQTNYSMQKYLIMKTILFLIICFIGFLFSVYQNYVIIKNVKYQVKQQEENKKNYIPQIINNRNRLYTQTSDQQNQQMKQSLIFDNGDSPVQKKKNKQLYLSNLTLNKPKISLFQIEMDQISSPIKKRKTINTNKIWKNKSLFQQLATANI